MAAPKASEVGAELERLDAAIKVLQAERAEMADTARSMLERNIAIAGPTKEYYLCPATTIAITCAAGILEDKGLSKDLRQKLTVVDTAKLKKFREGELIPDELWQTYVTEESKTVVQMRTRDLAPATPERKKQVLEAAA